MALKSVHWTFYNEANPAEKITVQDQLSAGVLAEVLKTHKDVWVVKEELSQNTSSPAAPAPSFTAAPPVLAQSPAPAPAPAPAVMESSPAPEAVSAPVPAEVTQTKLPPRRSSELTPPPLRQSTAKTEIPVEERRAQKRYNVDLRIILISKGRSFRSISQDVSLGGMKLKNKVPPEFLGTQCVAYISTSDAKENIEMVCQVIADPKDPRRVQFTDADSEQLKRLSRWLGDNELVKKAG